MHLSRICFKVAGGLIHDIIVLFVNDFVNLFGARTVAKCVKIHDFVNLFGGLLILAGSSYKKQIDARQQTRILYTNMSAFLAKYQHFQTGRFLCDCEGYIFVARPC